MAYSLRLDDLVDKICQRDPLFRQLPSPCGGRQALRAEATVVDNVDAALVTVEQAQAAHEAETVLTVHEKGTANALAPSCSAPSSAPGIRLSVGPGDPPTRWGTTTAP